MAGHRGRPQRPVEARLVGLVDPGDVPVVGHDPGSLEVGGVYLGVRCDHQSEGQREGGSVLP